MKKRSLSIRGHRTSLSLEDGFWEELTAIAAERGQPINALAAEIDEARGTARSQPRPDGALVPLDVELHHNPRA